MPSGEVNPTMNTFYPITPYQPTEWKTGDIVSSQGLNKIENNIGPLVVNADMENERVDASYNDIKAAILAGRPVFLMYAANVTDVFGTGFVAEMMPLCLIRDVDGQYFAVFTASVSSILSGNGQIDVYATDPDEPMSTNEPTPKD